MKADISKLNYQKRYQQYIDFENIIEEEYKRIGLILANSISSHFVGRDKITVLDIGCGIGRMPATLPTILPHNIELEIDYMDPVSEALDIYEKKDLLITN